MKTFKDSRGKKWAVSLTIGTVHAIKEKMGVDILDIAGGNIPFMTRLGTDILFFAEILEVVLQSQFEKMKDSEIDSMGEIFDPETLARAMTAFYEDLVNFFQSLNKTYEATALTKQLEAIEAATKEAAKRIVKMDVKKLAVKAIGSQMKKIENSLPNDLKSGGESQPKKRKSQPKKRKS